MAAPSSQANNTSRWHMHEVQSISGRNIGETVGSDWTTILRIDNRLFKSCSTMVYNQDGADILQLRVIGTLMDDSQTHQRFVIMKDEPEAKVIEAYLGAK